MLTLEQGKKLIELARNSIKSVFTKEILKIKEYEKEFSEKQGVFVTINKHNELRGCIGFPEPTFPLFRAIFDAARSAAFSDPRFPPVTEQELDEIEIEISVLSVPKEIEIENREFIFDRINIGEDGLIIRSDYGSGLLLPQVATEWKFDAKAFLENTCQKAGLQKDAWQDKNTKIFKFQAQIFTEEDGKIIEKRH